jgi:hypothetical protein
MHAPSEILSTWRKFDTFPMETLTKAWFYYKGSDKKQRNVSLMREHRSQFGITGNCFDLALWLLDEFKKDGIQAYPIGHHLNTEHAHMAVIALDQSGKRYLCDLGDQWLNPILIDSKSDNFSNKKHSGYFPAARVQVFQNTDNQVEIHYFRPNGNVSKQTYETEPIKTDEFLKAAEFSQNYIKPNPLLECRIPYKNETAHWEFYNFESFLSTTEGLFHDQRIDTVVEWAERISKNTGYDREFLVEALGVYKKQK